MLMVKPLHIDFLILLPKHRFNFNFSFSGFVEMMSAYFPDFSQIDTTAVYNWIFQLENQMSNEKKKEEKITHVSPKK